MTSITRKADIRSHHSVSPFFIKMCKHEAVPTIEAGLKVVKFSGAFEDAMFAKNLFLHDKKKKERRWLVIAAHDT